MIGTLLIPVECEVLFKDSNPLCHCHDGCLRITGVIRKTDGVIEAESERIDEVEMQALSGGG